VQAKRETESSIFNNFWMPVFTGMTVLMVLSAITTQSRRPESSQESYGRTPAFAGVTLSDDSILRLWRDNSTYKF
jgi:hypothetical protein